MPGHKTAPEIVEQIRTWSEDEHLSAAVIANRLGMAKRTIERMRLSLKMYGQPYPPQVKKLGRPRKVTPAPTLTDLELVRECDSFRYDINLHDIYRLYLPNDHRPHGYMLPSIVAKMPWTADFSIDHANHTVTLHDASHGTNTSQACNAAFATVVNTAIAHHIFPSLHGQHSEFYKILGAKYPVQIERFASHLFGITARGAHLTVYTTSTPDAVVPYSTTSTGAPSASASTMRIWVPRRSPTLFTFPNKLDTTVAGGIPAHQTPLENLIQESDEEASFPPELISRSARAAGVLTYIGRSPDGLIVPDCVYVYDLEVGADVIPQPKDGEVKDFNLMSVEEVKAALAGGEFKTNSAVVMLDFFVRHGILTSENERDYVEIVARMHRRLPFPTSESHEP